MGRRKVSFRVAAVVGSFEGTKRIEMSDTPTTITFLVGNAKRTVTAPDSWDALGERPALLIYNTLFSGFGSEYSHQAFTAVKLISMAQYILQVGSDFLAKWEADAIMQDAEHGQAIFLDELKQVVEAALSGLFDIQEDENGATSYAVKFNRTKNLYPALTHTKEAKKGKPGNAKSKTTWYYGPADGLANITIYEMAFAFGRYEAYVSTQDEQMANELIAILYRPSRSETQAERESAWKGDRRQPLRGYEGKIAERAKMAATLPMLTRRWIVFWFAGCREAIVKAYPRVFKKGGDGSGGGGWDKLLLSLAETGTFGALGETSDQHFSNALKYMEMKDEEAERAERAAKKRRP
jgi:hypothetical protein